MGVGDDDDQRGWDRCRNEMGKQRLKGTAKASRRPPGSLSPCSLLSLILHLTNDDQRESDGFQLFH